MPTSTLKKYLIPTATVGTITLLFTGPIPAALVVMETPVLIKLADTLREHMPQSLKKLKEVL
jgi:hypothetical protein